MLSCSRTGAAPAMRCLSSVLPAPLTRNTGMPAPPVQEAGVPVTNYGLLLSYAHSPAALERALKPWA